MGEIVEVPQTGGQGYRIHIGADMLAGAGEIVRGVARSNRVVIVTQPPIARHYAAPLIASLEKAGFMAPDIVTFAAGERHKNLRTLERLYDGLYSLRPAIDRKTTLLALGGGVVGDVVGFLAASYLRGLDYVQIPTTLLAMVDSSVGGKTGVDFREGKNLIGAFHRPRAVISDTDTLQTLTRREFVAGMAEVIKYGFIDDPALLPVVAKTKASPGSRGVFGALSADDIAYLVRRSCEIKADVVVKDEFETTGLRATLNFGHTIGHAIESATQYRRYKHGEAIAIGMVSAARIGVAAGITPPAVAEEIVRQLEPLWPTALPEDISDDTLIALLGRDKKSESGVAKFVLARAIGTVETGIAVGEEAIRAGLRAQRATHAAD